MKTTTQQRGATALYFALTLAVVGAFSAIAIEVEYLNVVHAQLQGVCDAATQAANLNIDGTAAGMVGAIADAQDVTAGMRVNGRPYSLDPTQVEFGYYDSAAAEFVLSNDPGLVNAARVVGTEVGVGLGFGQAFLGKVANVTACAAATRGPGNATTGDTGGPGLKNGHFDVDTTDPRHQCAGSTDCYKTTKHTHQYDDKYGVTQVDTFNVASGHLGPADCTDARGKVKSCGGGSTRVIEDGQPFKIIVINADLSPGVWLTINGVDTYVKQYDDATFADLPTYTLGAGSGYTQLTDLWVNFDLDAIADCKLIPTVTGNVKANDAGPNGEWRAGALTVQLVSPTATFSTGRSNGDHDVVANQDDGLMWESTYFWHWDGPPYVVADAADWQVWFDNLDCGEPVFIDALPASSGGRSVCP